MGEFDLIARYFTRPVRHAALGVGDDCAFAGPCAPACNWPSAATCWSKAATSLPM